MASSTLLSSSPGEGKEELKTTKKINVKNAISSQFPLKRVTLKESRQSEEYRAIMQRMHREQLVRILQRRFRAKHHYKFKGKYKETLNDRLTMRFIKEPIDDKYLEHAHYIQKGDWLNLDFNDPEFIRNIYKALRLNKINSYQLATVTLWYEAIQFFKNENNEVSLFLHSFEEKGAYDPASISYSNPTSISDFQVELKKLPSSERTYLTIDLPYEQEILFLLLLIFRIKRDGVALPSMMSMLEKYISKIDTSKEEKHVLLNDFPNLYKQENNEAVLEFILKQFRMIYPTIIPEKTNIDIWDMGGAIVQAGKNKNRLSYIINNYLLLIGNLMVAEENPALIISPHYRKEDPLSPLLCMVLPTLPALLALQKSLHQKDTTYPELTVGQLSPRDLLYCLMKPPHNLRPVELVHPDVRQEEKPHDVATTPFMLTWHDYFHTWRNGANMDKDLFCHLISSFQVYQKFEMSKIIWLLVDMDFSIGRAIRECKSDKVQIEKINMLVILLNRLNRITFFNFVKHYTNLLIIIDMIIYREKWKDFIGAYPEDFFPKSGREFYKRGGKYENFEDFHLALPEMKEIIHAHPKKDLYHTALFSILFYHLKKHPEGLALLHQFDKLGLDQFFNWDRDPYNGICISHKRALKKPLERYSVDDLYTQLKQLWTLHQESEAVSPLYAACRNGQYEVAKSILETNPTIINYAYDHSGVTSLYVASAYNHFHIVTLLLEHKADVNKKRTDNMTALIAASYYDAIESVSLLLQNNADPLAEEHNKTAFEWTTHNEIKKLILRAQIECFIKTAEPMEIKETVPLRFFKDEVENPFKQAQFLLDNDLNPGGMSSSNPVLSVLLKRARSLPRPIFKCVQALCLT